MSSSTDSKNLSVSQITELCQNALTHVHALPEAVSAVTEAMLWCELHGISSHGLNMLPTYLERAREGGINVQARPQIVHQHGCLIRMDGGGTFGQYIASAAVEAALAAAKSHGTGLVSVFNANHAGALACFTQLIAQAGMVGFMAHNANPAVAPYGGREAALGTNPLSFAFPGTDFPVLVDLATSATAKGKLYELARGGDQIPAGLALNINGEPTTSVAEAIKGILLPLGGPKGYALAVAVEMLTGVLGGDVLGPDIPSFHKSPNRPQGISMLVMAIDIDGLIPLDEFKTRVDEFQRKLTSNLPASGFSKVQIPGEREAQLALTREQEGIAVKQSILDDVTIQNNR